MSHDMGSSSGEVESRRSFAPSVDRRLAVLAVGDLGVILAVLLVRPVVWRTAWVMRSRAG